MMRAGSGGVMITGDLSGPIKITYTEERMAAHEFHSTIREVLNVLTTVQCLLEAVPTQVRGNRLLYLTDSQAAFYALMGMKSKQKESIHLVF